MIDDELSVEKQAFKRGYNEAIKDVRDLLRKSVENFTTTEEGTQEMKDMGAAVCLTLILRLTEAEYDT